MRQCPTAYKDSQHLATEIKQQIDLLAKFDKFEALVWLKTMTEAVMDFHAAESKAEIDLSNESMKGE